MNRRQFFITLGLPAMALPAMALPVVKLLGTGKSKIGIQPKDRLLIGNCTKCWQSQYRYPFGKDDSGVPVIMEIHLMPGTCSCGGRLDKWVIINEFGMILDVDIKNYRYAYP